MRLNLEVKSPVTIAGHRGVTNEIYTLDYIPGTVIRGALAEAYIREYIIAEPMRNEIFCGIFLSGKSIFGNLYPAKARIIPDSAITCKYEKGFKPEGHGIADIVIPLINGENNLIEYCDKCGAPMASIKGFFKENSDGYASVPVSTRFLPRTAVSFVSDTAKNGSLFTMEAIDERQFFTGTITVPGNLKDNMNAFLSGNKNLRIGSSRSRGQGECVVTLGKDEPETGQIEKRLKAFNGLINDKEHVYFSITLLSDAIVHDQFLRYKNAITVEDLIEALDDSSTVIKDFEIDLAIARTRIVSGWNYAPNIMLPKEDMMAIQKGAVFVYKSNSPLTEEDTRMLMNDLQKLPLHIGERVCEGFGKISICDDFHIKFYAGGQNR